MSAARAAEETCSEVGGLLLPQGKGGRTGRRNSAVKFADEMKPTISTINKATNRNFQIAGIAIYPSIPSVGSAKVHLGLDGWRGRFRREQATGVYFQQRQIAGCVGPGVDIDAVTSHVGMPNGGVTVNDKLTKVLLAIEELIPDPK